MPRRQAFYIVINGIAQYQHSYTEQKRSHESSSFYKQKKPHSRGAFYDEAVLMR